MSNTPTPENPAAENPDDGIEDIKYCDRSPNGFKTPYYQWADKLANDERPPHLIELKDETYRAIQVERGQPFRRALTDQEETGLPIPRTRGPLMLPESFDPIANDELELEPDPDPGIPLHIYAPGAKAHETLAAMAHDMVEVGSVMVARMRVSLGYEPDAKMIRLYKELALALSKMYYVTREHEAAKSKSTTAEKPKRGRGRPRKSV